ncbi:MAG: DUF2828 family protein [Syntrophothermus sp.]
MNTDRFFNNMKAETNNALTENGANVYATTTQPLVDMVALIGSMRACPDRDVIDLFLNAFNQDKLIATKLIFYFRDIREGQGERKIFRTIMRYLACNYPEIVEKNITYIPEFGRWDDLLEFIDTPCQQIAFEIIERQLKSDIDNKNPSLLAKWLPSRNASSKDTKYKAYKLMTYLNLTEREYRIILSSLRKRIDIIETKITKQKYSDINYSTVPSCANKKYYKLFWKYDTDRYQDFISRINKGDKSVKINSKDLFPHEIIREILNNSDTSRFGYSYYSSQDKYTANDIQKDMSLKALWNAIPNYITEPGNDVLCVIDTSGSMSFNNYLPLSVAIALGLYFAERNKGRFKNKFITFSERPKAVELQGDDICSKTRDVLRYSEVANTNIAAVFDLILNTAKKYNLAAEEIPKKLIIISDMQFDSQTSGINRDTEKLMNYVRNKWNGSGYRFPSLTYWNVEGRNKNFPDVDSAGVQFISGFSPKIFNELIQDVSSMELVMKIANKERYNCITV